MEACAAAVCRSATELVGPLDHEERRALVSRSRNSRPGQSGWKLAFLQCSLDVQRGCGLVADSLKTGAQVNIPNTKGGYRPLTMLEEGFKAVEGPVTRRLARVRQRLAPSAIYSSMNRAFDPGISAAPEVLYLDTLLTEEAMRLRCGFCRLPTDYEKFFNTISVCGADAVLLARGIPPSARRLFAAAFSDMRDPLRPLPGQSC